MTPNFKLKDTEIKNLILDFLFFGAPLDDKYFYDINIRKRIDSLIYNDVGDRKYINDKEVLLTIDHLMLDYIERETKQYSKIGILLSGGIDSANILYYLSKLNKNIYAYTWGDRGLDSEDVVYSKISSVDPHVLKHTIIPNDNDYENQIFLFVEYVKKLKIPLNFFTSISYIKMSKKIIEDDIPIVFNGQNADTLFMAYPAPVITWRFFRIFNFIKLHKIFTQLNPMVFISRFSSWGVFRYIKTDRNYRERLLNFFNPIDSLDISSQQKIVLMEELYTQSVICQNQQRLILENDKVKTLNPYYDKELIKFIISLPDVYRKKNNFKKDILYELARRNGVSEHIINKNKRGLSYDRENFIKSNFHIKIWREILKNKELYKYIDVSSLFNKERDNFVAFNRVMSLHYFLKYVLNNNKF